MESLLIWGIALLALALLLLVAEVFLPSAGIITLVASAIALSGLVCLFKVSTTWGVAGTLSVLVLAPVIFAWGLRIMPSTPLGRRLIGLPEQTDEDQAPPDDKPDALAALIGKHGTALTDLRPVGVVRIGDEKFDALSEVSYIRAGTAVRVSAIDGTQVKVRPLA